MSAVRLVDADYIPFERGENPMTELIRVGDTVTIVDRFGQRHSGRAVMRGPHGWVINLGGPHGTPGIADDDNTVSVRRRWGKKMGGNPVRGCVIASNPELLEWSSQGGSSMFPMASNPKKRRGRSRKSCIKRCRKKIKRGRRLLTWGAAVKRFGVMGAKTYRNKFGVKKLKRKGSRRRRK